MTNVIENVYTIGSGVGRQTWWGRRAAHRVETLPPARPQFLLDETSSFRWEVSGKGDRVGGENNIAFGLRKRPLPSVQMSPVGSNPFRA